jgi:hypothetical protein
VDIACFSGVRVPSLHWGRESRSASRSRRMSRRHSPPAAGSSGQLPRERGGVRCVAATGSIQ